MQTFEIDFLKEKREQVFVGIFLYYIFSRKSNKIKIINKNKGRDRNDNFSLILEILETKTNPARFHFRLRQDERIFLKKTKKTNILL